MGKSKISAKEAQEALNKASGKAKDVIKDKEKTEGYLAKALSKIGEVSGLDGVVDNLHTIISMIRSYINGEYKEVPIGTIIGLLGAIIYFVSPVDIIPDFIPAVGYADDAAVIALAIKLSLADVEDYKKWAEKHGKM